MKINTLITKLTKALNQYGNIDVTVSETLWMYNPIKSIRYIKHPYQDSNETVIELSDAEWDEDEDYWEIL